MCGNVPPKLMDGVEFPCVLHDTSKCLLHTCMSIVCVLHQTVLLRACFFTAELSELCFENCFPTYFALRVVDPCFELCCVFWSEICFEALLAVLYRFAALHLCDMDLRHFEAVYLWTPKIERGAWSLELEAWTLKNGPKRDQ